MDNDMTQTVSLGKKRWRVLNTDVTESILPTLVKNRQIDDVDTFMKPDFDHDLHNPFLLPDMENAVGIIRNAQKNQQKVMIIGDYDADGITGTALLYEMLKAVGITNIVCRLPHRIRDGYGCQPHIVEEAIRDQVDVILTVDNGISSYDAIALAKQHDIHVIICDHHTIPDTLPQADAILHPKIDQCGYPFRDLTGVGVAYKFAQAVCPRLLPSKEAEKFLKWNLDLVAIGTVADCATVLGENRVLIKYGLKVLEKLGNNQTTRRPGLQNVLKQCAGKTPSYDATLIGFRIAPRINAAGRLSHPDSSLKLLITHDMVEAELLARELQELNTSRQEKTVEAVNQAKQQLWQDTLTEKILIARNKEWHPGIVGLIAGRLTEEFHRPSIIFHENENGDLVASARSTKQFNIIQAITTQQALLERFGGHSQAAGCTMAMENYEEFRENMQQLANEALSDEDLYPTLDIDCELYPHAMSMELKREIDSLEPYGIGNVRPIFLMRDLEVQSVNAVGRNGAHAQVRVRAKDRLIKGIAFQQGYLAQKLSQGDLIQVACCLQENHWNGKTSLEIEVIDVMRDC
jgi:single-stranded-DNA-specific exonuclease